MSPTRPRTPAKATRRSLGPVEPMLARQVEALPRTGKGLRFEPKWDGFRAIATVDRDRGVNLDSRRGKSLKLGFPDVVAALFTRTPADTILDGELVRWADDGRLDFGALQRRNHTTIATAAKLAADEPCHFIVFDLLRDQGTDLTDQPLSDRRAALEALFAEIPGTSPLQLGLHTDDLATAREWFDGLAAVGVEGIVVKPASSRYRRRRSPRLWSVTPAWRTHPRPST
jgi:ATP-dependent DNA ligase